MYPVDEHPPSVGYQKIRSMQKFAYCLLFTAYSFVLFAQQKTYCNPTNMDYGYTPYESFTAWGRHRATADPFVPCTRSQYWLPGVMATGLQVTST